VQRRALHAVRVTAPSGDLAAVAAQLVAAPAVPTHWLVSPDPDSAAGAAIERDLASWRIGWTDDAFVAMVDVRDSDPTAAYIQPAQLFRGDSVHFEFGPDPRGLAPTARLRVRRDCTS
jgi:hypothetical protein